LKSPVFFILRHGLSRRRVTKGVKNIFNVIENGFDLKIKSEEKRS